MLNIFVAKAKLRDVFDHLSLGLLVVFKDTLYDKAKNHNGTSLVLVNLFHQRKDIQLQLGVHFFIENRRCPHVGFNIHALTLQE